MLYGNQFRLFIDSAPGRGTLVRITIPVDSNVIDFDTSDGKNKVFKV